MAIIEQMPVAPPLCAGDKMTREEFLHLWDLHPEIKRAELIGGVVYMPSPVSTDHWLPEDDLGGWLFTYRSQTPGTQSGGNATTKMLEDSPQPDRHLAVLPECGGKSWIEDNYLHGSPELMLEVSVSSRAYDLHQKYDLYETARVQEYVALLVFEQKIRWHHLVDGRYQILPPDADGILRSRVFPGLWLDPQALLNRDIQKVLVVLQAGLASPEHQAFVERLAQFRKPG